MPRWKQIVDDDGKSQFIAMDDAARANDGVAIHSQFEPFVSPIDHTIISDRKQYREHCKKHNVVPAQEFSPEFYKAKAEERARELNGQYSKEEVRARKQEIYNIGMELERRNGS